jgi:UrcA family protein
MTVSTYRSALARRKHRERQRRLRIGFAILAATAAFVGTGVIASEAHAAPAKAAAIPLHYSQRIAYRDLDLSRPDDVAVLHRRVRLAARHLCTVTPAMRDAGYVFLETCFPKAVAEGRRQIKQAVELAQNGRKTMLASDAGASRLSGDAL